MFSTPYNPSSLFFSLLFYFYICFQYNIMIEEVVYMGVVITAMEWLWLPQVGLRHYSVGATVFTQH